jgi:hypothetical protein
MIVILIFIPNFFSVLQQYYVSTSLSKLFHEEGRGRRSQSPTKLVLGGLVNTNAPCNLVQLFEKYYTVKTWKNTHLCVHHDIKKMDFEFGLKMWALLSCYNSVVRKIG